LAIESIRALLPMIDQIAPQQAAPIRDALSQLQLAFVRIGGAPAATAESPRGSGAAEPQGAPPEPGPEPTKPGEPGPAQRSGRLWVPGQ